MDNYLVSAGYLPCKTQYHRVTHLTRFMPDAKINLDDIFSSDADNDAESANESGEPAGESFVVFVVPAKESTAAVGQAGEIKFDDIVESIMDYLNNSIKL